MPAGLELSGAVLDRNRVVHSVNERIGYCLENPLEVVRRLARTHRIRAYEEYEQPFEIDDESFGLRVQTATEVSKEYKIFHLDSLMEKIDKERTIEPEGPNELLLKTDPWYAYNPLPVNFSIQYSKPLSKEELLKAFLVGLERFNGYYRITDDLYWVHLDDSLYIHLKDPYVNKRNAQAALRSINKKAWCPGIWVNNQMSIEKILPMLRKIPNYSLEKEKEIYDEFNRRLDRFKRAFELLSIFGVEQATYYGLKKFIMKHRTKLKRKK